MTGLPGGAGNPNVPPTWASPATVAASAAAVLRITQNDPDYSRIETAAESAIDLIDQYLDRADDPIIAPTPRPVIDAAIQVTIEVYRRKDAPFGVLGGFSDTDTGPVRIGSDALKGVESLLSPYSHRYGVG